MEKKINNLSSFNNRISKLPIYSGWFNTDCGFKDSYKEETEADFSGLNDHEKLALYVYAYTKIEMAVFKRGIINYFGWTNYKVRKIVREINANETDCHIDIVSTFSEDTGLLSGKGYQLDIIRDSPCHIQYKS